MKFIYFCFMKKIRTYIVILLPALLSACANVGSPNGGPYDETPPRFVSSSPVRNQTHYAGKSVEILFDELIQIEKPSENVIITPPQMQLPTIRTAGRKIMVELHDSLQENTTYTIDFTSSIADNNEKNVLENFSFAFSTGDVIDSLEVSGFLLNAANLEPMPGITVGLHRNTDDTAFVKEAFVRTSRTNDRGWFAIRNIAPGAYRIYALNDKNRDYKFDQPGEDIAFLDSLIIPAFEFTARQDTLWKDSLTIDTIRTVEYTRFTPDNIELRLFLEKFERQYILRPERPQENRFSLRFNAPLDTLPVPQALNFEPADSSWYVAQWTEGKKAINYWLTDSLAWKQDTLRISIQYPASDSLNVLHPRTDTVDLFLRNRPQETRKRTDKDTIEVIDFLGIQTNASGVREIYDSISIVFDEPVLGFGKDAIAGKDLFYLDRKVDTLWTPVEFDFLEDTTNILGFFIHRKWRYGEEYRLEADSAAIHSVYGRWINHISQTFKIKEEDEYGHLFINIAGLDSATAFVELLNTADEPIRKAATADGGALFMNLAPGKYYARLVVDENNNGLWDTGNYADKRQPEVVYYYPKTIEIMKNWQIEIQDPPWNIHAMPFNRQKPMEITKNKPNEVTKPKRDYKNEGKQTTSSPQAGMGGLRF
ncbi:MAG: Ig-like domain-containing protein [Tannerellaceae bacterium]|nr:Ig-like domain-containing protein [Tannerellaceae bacterium]